jgi:hypothetical protein
MSLKNKLINKIDLKNLQRYYNNHNKIMNQQDMNQHTDMELSQKQKQQLNSILAYNLANECEYSDDEYTSDEEDPTPKWNIPNWKGNAKEVVKKCTGCITRTSTYGTTRGCGECDEYWDMPDLEEIIISESESDSDEYERDDFYDRADDPYLAERIYMQRELNGELDEEEHVNLTPYCEGCELLNAGLGGENQMSHACLRYF